MSRCKGDPRPCWNYVENGGEVCEWPKEILAGVARILRDNAGYNLGMVMSTGEASLLAAALLASPIFQQVAAQAWSEGFDSAERDLMEHDRHEWDNDCIPNPYTVEGTDPLAALKANPASRDSALRGDHD